MRIAVDAMGGDYAPAVVVEGITTALYDFPEYELTIVGHLGKLSYYLEKYGIEDHPRLKQLHAEQVIEMGDSPTVALRSKKHSSMTACARLLKEGKVDAIVSAGNTGAAVAATKVIARTLPGVDRPMIAASMPALSGRFVLGDSGANVDCRPIHLVQFAIMAEVYAKYLFGIDKPTIGLLSVGGEAGKGNDLTKEVFQILSKLPINFIGNVEGNNVFQNVADVVVCDGFIGNVLLKSAEGLSKTTMLLMKELFSKTPARLTGALLSRSAFKELKAFADPDDFGGAPLLGINGICIISHGSASAKAVRNAIRAAGESVQFGVNDKIVRRIAETKEIIESMGIK
ncbi:MAG: phosphate acyltransferase PlsX [Victivallales bacterium]|nr:phosphate acyltransferase PlsX [Victivallales bacterium]